MTYASDPPDQGGKGAIAPENAAVVTQTSYQKCRSTETQTY